jgi:hypothetical protein
MTVMIQASVKDKLGNLYNIKSEADEPEVAWADLGAVLSSVGGAELAQGVRAHLADALSREWEEPNRVDPLAQAVGVAQTGLPGAQVVPPAQAWGNPPVPPMLPAAAVNPAQQFQHGQPGGTPCVHGTRTYIDGITKSGKNAGKPWRAWACPAPQGSQCDKEWIRD